MRALRGADRFIVKHWELKHPEKLTPLEVEFSVIHNHKDSMLRLLHEAFLIEEDGTMTSKCEWRSSARLRLVVEKKEWEGKKEERKMMEERLADEECPKPPKKVWI